MRLTVFTDYSLRLLIYLGAHEGRLSTIDEVAGAYGISRNHVMKVVNRLGRLGYIETLRGKHGGFRLARPPQSITLGRLVRDTEEDLALVECFQNEPRRRCAIEPACRLSGILGEGLRAFLATLDRYTLADLLEPRGELRRLLDTPPYQPAKEMMSSR